MSRGWPLGFAKDITERARSYGRDADPEGLEASRGLQPDGLYYLTKTQVDNILSMNLRRLTGLEREKIIADYSAMMERIFDLIDILRKPERVTAIIREELLAIREAYGDERRSTVDLEGDPNFNKRDLIPRRDMVVSITRGGYVKSQELSDYNAQKRGGSGRNVQATVADDAIEKLFIANTHDIILCFSTLGQVYGIDVFDLPEGKASSRGRPIVNLLPLDEGEKISFILPIQGFDDEKFVLFATNMGTVKRSRLSEFAGAVRLQQGVRAMSFDEGEHLIGVSLTSGEDDVFLFNTDGFCVRFKETDVRVMGRAAHGVRGIRLAEGQSVIALATCADSDKFVLTATSKGFGKLTAISDFPINRRGSKGRIAIRTSEENGSLVAALIVTPEDDIMLLSTGGKVVRTRAGEIPVRGRRTKGVILIRMGKDTLATIERIDRTGEEDEDEVTHLDIENVPEDDASEEEESEDLEMDDAEDSGDAGEDEKSDAGDEAGKSKP